MDSVCRNDAIFHPGEEGSESQGALTSLSAPAEIQVLTKLGRKRAISQTLSKKMNHAMAIVPGYSKSIEPEPRSHFIIHFEMTSMAGYVRPAAKGGVSKPKTTLLGEAVLINRPLADL